MSLNGSAHLSTTMAVVLQAIIGPLLFSLISNIEIRERDRKPEISTRREILDEQFEKHEVQHEKHLAAGLRSVVFDMNFILGAIIRFL